MTCREMDAKVPQAGLSAVLPRREDRDWEHTQAVLAACNGVVSQAARRLGITRQALQYHLKKPRPRA